MIANWDKHIKTRITSKEMLPLDADLLAYVNAFDFSIFDAKTALQLIEDHRYLPAQ